MINSDEELFVSKSLHDRRAIQVVVMYIRSIQCQLYIIMVLKNLCLTSSNHSTACVHYR